MGVRGRFISFALARRAHKYNSSWPLFCRFARAPNDKVSARGEREKTPPRANCQAQPRRKRPNKEMTNALPRDI